VRADIKTPEGHAGGARRAQEGRVWYFAFGLSMDPQRMEQAVGAARPVCVAELYRHVLRFVRPAAERHGTAAAVPTENPSDIVWGVVWECAAAEARALDELEGIGTGCSWVIAEVRDKASVRYAVKVAIVDDAVCDGSLLPSRVYRDRLLEVAKAYPFSKIYLSMLRSSPTL